MTLSEGLLSSKSAVAVKGMAYLVWCLFFVVFAHSVKAQDNVGDESTIRYPAEYFVDFNPMTAQDMVYRIPGVQTSSRSRPAAGVAVEDSVVAEVAKLLSTERERPERATQRDNSCNESLRSRLII